MPAIEICYDGSRVSESEANLLSQGIQKIVSQITGIEDVFVYADNPKIQVKAAPIEIFIKMSDYKISDEKELMEKIKIDLSGWKNEHHFHHLINLTLIPMHWLVEIGV